MKIIKDNVKFIIVIFICIIASSITTLATSYLFNSNEVSYDNTNSGLHADSIQDAIDEVFQHATDYSEIKTKIGTGSLTTTSNTLIGGINELNSNKINTSAIANNLTTTSSGKVLDARQGKTLNDNIGTLSSLTTTAKTSTVAAINEVNSKANESVKRITSIAIDSGKTKTVALDLWVNYLVSCARSGNSNSGLFLVNYNGVMTKNI